MKMTSKGQKCVAEDCCRRCRRPLEKLKVADTVIKCCKLWLVGKMKVSSLPYFHVEYYSTTLFTFCWLRLVTIETARHCRRVAESMNAQNSGRRATRLVAQSINWPLGTTLWMPLIGLARALTLTQLNLRSDLKMAVHQQPPSNLTELGRICREEWQKIPKFGCAMLVASYPRRLEAVISAKSASTKYWVKGLNICQCDISVFDFQ